MSEDRITSTNSYIGEARQEAGLRPQTLDDYIGQQGVKDTALRDSARPLWRVS